MAVIGSSAQYYNFVNCSFFSFSLFFLPFCCTNHSAAAAAAAAAMMGATVGQPPQLAAVSPLGALAGGPGGPQMMATPFGMLSTAPRFR